MTSYYICDITVTSLFGFHYEVPFGVIMSLGYHGYNVIVVFRLPSLESNHELVACTSTSCFAHSSCSECTTSGCLWCPSLRQCVHLNGYPYTYIYGQCLGWVNGQSVACPGEQREGLCMLESHFIAY